MTSVFVPVSIDTRVGLGLRKVMKIMARFYDILHSIDILLDIEGEVKDETLTHSVPIPEEALP
jgi:hypothetical protein